jgi:hypothetical protein
MNNNNNNVVSSKLWTVFWGRMRGNGERPKCYWVHVIVSESSINMYFGWWLASSGSFKVHHDHCNRVIDAGID